MTVGLSLGLIIVCFVSYLTLECEAIYRVAQIKISHWTKCNFSTTVWYFYTQISWIIWERSCYNSEL